MKITFQSVVMATLAATMTLGVAWSQPLPPPAPAAVPPAAIGAAGSASAPTAKGFTQQQLDQMLASIALYPDALLSQIFMASTYPLEIVEAHRWAKSNASLKGSALQDALKGQAWDESVKSLTAFPEVLNRMNSDLAWTQQMGDAFLGQQQQVMDTVQRLRKKAQDAGNLATNEQQKVVVQNNYITVEPASPTVVYVPTYNPMVVYGPWWYPTYPPYYPPYWAAPGAAFARGVFWGAGIAAGAAMWGGFNWNNHDVNINVNKYNNFNRTNISNSNWQHNAAHREGVPYRDNGARQKYGSQDRQAVQARDQFRGRSDSPGGQGLNDRSSPQQANRAGAGQERPGAAANRQPQPQQHDFSGNRASDRGGSYDVGNGAQTRDYSSRGASSMGSQSAGAARGGGGGGGGRGGGGRGGGGGRR